MSLISSAFSAVCGVRSCWSCPCALATFFCALIVFKVALKLQETLFRDVKVLEIDRHAKRRVSASTLHDTWAVGRP